VSLKAALLIESALVGGGMNEVGQQHAIPPLRPSPPSALSEPGVRGEAGTRVAPVSKRRDSRGAMQAEASDTSSPGSLRSFRPDPKGGQR
jgi:hypothetical protein